MDIEMSTVRLLGAAQLFILVAGTISDRLLKSVVGSGSISDKLVNISNNIRRIRISNLLALADSIGIAVLGVLFYTVFNKEYKIIALVALVFFLAEAITLAVSKIGTYALMPLSQEFVEAGSPKNSYFQSFGKFLYSGVDRVGYDIHMLFFALGGILWYYLLYISNSIPRGLSVWGLVAILLLSIPVLLVLYKRDFEAHPVMILFLPYLPYELVLGVWLIVKGFN